MQEVANRYRVVRLLGEGGMGRVFLARDESTGQDVALKVLATGADEAATLRFKQEFWAMAQIRHPNLIAAVDFGVDPEAGPYFTMEVVPGDDLESAGRRDPEFVRSILPQLLDALAAIHGRGLVHGDLKPANLRITPEGRLVVMDLGLVARAGRSGEAAFGTLEYMAPEVLRKGRVDHRADLYSVGVVLYRLLTGKLPFEGATVTAFVRAALSDRALPPSRLVPGLDEGWDEAVLRLLEKDPAERFASCADLAAALGVSIQETAPRLLVPRFVGRQHELAALTDRLGKLLSGSGGDHVALVGEAGLGKTRIIDEFRTRVQLSEGVLYAARCRPDGYPYQPFADLLRQVVPQARALAPQVADRSLPHLSRILPDLGIEAAPGLDPDQERIRLQSSCADLLRAVSQIRGTVFVLEDWDQADVASRDLLRSLLRMAPDAPWLWVLSAETGCEFPTAFRELSLTGLSAAEVGDMAASMLNQEAFPEDLADRLHAMTGGVPAMVEEVVGHWVNTGAIVYHDRAWHLGGARTAGELPRGLVEIMAARAAALPEPALRVVSMAAAIGLEFRLPVLAAIMGLAPDDLFPVLLQLVGLGILEPVEGGSFRFRQPAMQRALQERIPGTERPALHTAIAGALERLGDGSLEAVSAIARHHLAGTDPDAAIRWALEAGKQALELVAVGDAERLLEEGFARAMAQEAPEAIQLEYRLAMGHLSRLAGRVDAARQHYEVGLELARKLAARGAEATCLVSLARVHQMKHENQESRRWLAEAMPACQAAGDDAGEARCLLSLARISHFEGKSVEAIDLARKALDVASRAGVLPLIANAQCFLGFLLTHVEPRREVEGLELLEASVELSRRLGDRYQMNESTLNMGNVQLALGDYPGARESFEACLRYCQDMGATSEEIFALVSLSQVLVEMGRAADALLYAQSAENLARQQGRKFPLAFALAMEAQAHLLLGDLVLARTLVQDALKLAREIQNRYVELLILGSQAEIQTYLGEWEAALDTVATARELMAATGNNEPALKLAILDGYLGALLYGNDRPLRDALEEARRKRSQGQAALALGYLARLARQEGRLEEARQLAYEAASLASEVQLVHLSAEMACLLGDLTRQDDRAEAHDYYSTAHESANLLRAPLLRALALHGLSGTSETPEMAVSFWEQAVAELRKLLAPLNAATRELFLRFPERRAIQADRPAMAPGDPGVNLAHLRRLTRFATAIGKQGSTDGVLELALEEILDLAGAERGFLLLYDGLELKSRVIAARTDEAVDMESFSSSIAKQVLWTGEPVYLVDALADDRFKSAQSVLALDLKTVLCLPLIAGGDVLGVLYVDSQSIQRPLGEPDLEVAMALADQAAAAIASSRRVERAEARARASEAIAALARPAAAGDTPEFLRAALGAAMAITGAERGFYLEGPALELRAACDRDLRPLGEEERTFSRSVCQWVLASGETVSVLDAQKDERWQQQRSVMSLELRTVHCTPVKGPEGVLGVLYVDSRDVGREDTTGLVEVAGVMGAYLARPAG